jgi:hypothetical protein
MELIEIILVIAFIIYILISIGDGSFKRFLNKHFHTYTYYIKNSTIDPNFKQLAGDILRASSIHSEYNLRETEDQYNADIMMELISRDRLTVHHTNPEYYPGTSKMIRYSLTWQQNIFYNSAKIQPYCAIDSENWINGVPESGLSLQEYREYIIQHEFLHGLGYNHVECNGQTAPNGICPILYQSTKGCPDGFKCGYEITSFDYTKKIPNATYQK